MLTLTTNHNDAMKKFLLFLFCVCQFSLGFAQDDPSEPLILHSNPEMIKDNNDNSNSYFNDFESSESQNGLGMSRFMGEMLQMAITLGIIIVVMFAATWFIKRMLNTRIQQVNANSSIKILERRVLSAKAMIYLLDVQGKGLLIGETHSGLTRLGEFNLKEEYRSFDQVMREQTETDETS